MFRAVNRIFYCPELVQGSKNKFSTRNFTFLPAGDVGSEIKVMVTIYLHSVPVKLVQTELDSLLLTRVLEAPGSATFTRRHPAAALVKTVG